MLFLYLLANLQLEGLHESLHHYNHELHSVSNEADPCHVTVYHSERQGGCEHDSHFTKDTHCPICDSQVQHSVQITITKEVEATFNSPVEHSETVPSSVTESFIALAKGRAPPVV